MGGDLLTAQEAERVFKAFKLIQVIATKYRGFGIHPRPAFANVESLQELFDTLAEAELQNVEAFMEALSMNFYNQETNQMLRIKFILNDVTEDTMAYILGMDASEQKLQGFLKGCLYYVHENKSDLTIMAVFLRPVRKKIETKLFKMQKDLNVRFEFYSIQYELQLNPFDFVMQSKQSITSKDVLEEMDPETFSEELVDYSIRQNTMAGGGSITAKFLGARNGQIIHHQQLVTATQTGYRLTSFRRVRELYCDQ